MTLARWLRAAFAARPACKQPARRLSVECLEDRENPSGGLLDPTFGSGGVVITNTLTVADAHRVVVQPDGKIIAAGIGGHTTPWQYGLARYNPDGSLDTTFGSGGMAVIASSSKSASSDANDVALQTDGKIVVADGIGWNVIRLNPNGTLDTTFGTKGQVAISMLGFSMNNTGDTGSLSHLTIQSDGKIVVAGDVKLSAVVGLARLNSNGSLDTTFGNKGTVETTLSSNSWLTSVALQADGRIVVAGASTSPQAFLVARYNSNGSLDSGFGSGGIVTTGFGATPYQQADAVLVQADGKIVAAGYTYGYFSGWTYIWAVARYNPDGSLDAGFGSGGRVTTHEGGAIQAAALGADGNIVAVGDNNSHFAAGRYLTSATVINGVTYAAGSLDPTFGSGGVSTTAVASNSNYLVSSWGIPPRGVAIQPDGKIVQAGTAWGPFPSGTNQYPFAVLRYLASAPQIGSFAASSYAPPAGSSLTLTASNITDGNPNSTVTRVDFYYFDGSGNKVSLGTATAGNGGAWSVTFTVNLAPGSYTIYAQATDSYGAVGDPTSFGLQVV